MDRRHKHEEHENDERWLITYADLITLLMVFFVVMWSISRADAAKFATVAKSLSVAFGAPKSSVVQMPETGTSHSSKNGQKTTPADTAKAQSRRLGGSAGDHREQLRAVAAEIEKMIKEQGLQDLVALGTSADGRKLTIRLRDSVLFERGGAELTPSAMELISRLGGVLRDIGMRVAVSGHTDNTPIKSAAYRSNWYLSTARSTAVIEYLIEHDGFPPQLLSASGNADNMPIVPNDTQENRAKNRRVEFVITDEGAIDLPNAAAPAPAAAVESTEAAPVTVEPAPEAPAAAPAVEVTPAPEPVHPAF